MIEYRVKPVTRYIVTRFSSEDADMTTTGSVTERGEFPNAEMARSAAVDMWIGDKLQHGEGLPNIERMVYDIIDDSPTGPRVSVCGNASAAGQS